MKTAEIHFQIYLVIINISFQKQFWHVYRKTLDFVFDKISKPSMQKKEPHIGVKVLDWSEECIMQISISFGWEMTK